MLLRTILFTGAIQGLFQLLLLLAKNKNHTADYWLMGWLFLVSAQLFFYYENTSVQPFLTGIGGGLAFSIPLISAPVLYQYIRSLSFNKQPDRLILALYTLPWISYVIIIVATMTLYPAGLVVTSGFPHFNATIPDIVIYLLTYPMALLPGGYAVMGLYTLRRYQKSLPDNYSYTESINLNWLKWLVISILLLFIFLFGLIRFGIQERLLNAENLFLYVGTVLSIYVFLIGYLGLRQNTLLLSAARDFPLTAHSTTVPYQKTGLDATAVEQIYLQLLGHMETEQPYLKDDLSLATLAQQLSLNTNQLSQVINQKAESNFFTFVNRYRVEAVKIKLKDPAFAHLSILGIAYECGFRSKSAFNRIFKEQTGISPLQYQKQEFS
ncbi:MAG: AraC family transcriptional regulator [Pedobacter sp.]|nr:AraC family transcriptional regulator [Pedobacter sp.]